MAPGRQLQYNIHECNDTFLVGHADEFAELCRKSFYEHDVKGINFGPINMTPTHFAQRVQHNIGMYAEFGGRIIAFWNVKPDYDKNIAYGDILAVDPEFKGMHIGSHLTKRLVAWLSEKQFKLFLTDTSLKAPHVVRFHKSYGCKAVGMKHFRGRNYRSVMLRLALKPQNEISDFYAASLFFISKMICGSLVNEDGRYTLLGKFLYKIKNRM